MMKKECFDKLLKSMSRCDKCTSFKCKGKSLINIYSDYIFSINIPSIWTDWFNRLDSKIMIIGQDWGPYNDMKKLNNSLKEDKSNWNELIELEKSNTKKLLENYIKESSNSKYSLNDIFITNAIMCARQGDNYRGNNIGHDIVIRHTIENDVIKDSYVGFKKDGKMYYLKGSDTSVYNKNKEIIKELFGSGKCIDQGNIYMCNDDNVGVIARTDGSAEVRIDNQYCISYDNFAKCGNK